MSEGETTKDAKPQPRIGSYRILHSLGSGGMSSVFKAVHMETGHEVAVKVLPRALAKNVTLLQRFLREAKSAEALEHPNIVSIYDRGVDQGRHYLVLEFVHGGDLHDRVRNNGPLGIGEAVSVIRSVSKGLEFAASRGLIHRDIKPANLLLNPEGRVKIIDLGLALQSENEDERVTREGTTVGTVDYMSPEQARDSRATSEQSDIYSLGCTLYFLLTGQPPFPGGDVADKLSRHCLQSPPDPRKLRPEVPGPLSVLMRRMMAKRPENRFASYQELIDELDAVPTGAEAPVELLPAAEKPAPEPPAFDKPAPGTTAEAPLYALFDDAEEDDDEREGESGPPPAAPQPLYALVEDDESSDDAPLPELLGLLGPESPARRPVPRDREPTPARTEVSMAELASLAGDSEASIPARKNARPNPASPASKASSPLDDLLGDEDSADEGDGDGVAQYGARRSDDPTKKIVMMYSLIGLGLVLLVIGTHQLIRTTSATPELEVPVDSVDAGPPEVVPPPLSPPPPPVEVAHRPDLLEKPRTPRPAAGKAEVAAPPPVAWIEPRDPSPEVLPETELNPKLESEFTQDWATAAGVNSRVGKTFVTVRRIVDSGDPAQTPSLRPSEVGGGTIELADNGPFFVDDLRTSAELIRARPGYRPIVSIEPSTLGAVSERPAVFELKGRNLTLVGLDLVVNVSALSPTQTALFLCRGGTLNLRDCSITILGAKGPSSRGPLFALVRAGGTARQETKVRLERTLIRGSAFNAVEFGGGLVDVVFSRSVVVSGRGGVFACASTDPGAVRRIRVIRSLICSRGPAIELGGTTPMALPGEVKVQALGSSFANLAGEGTASLISAVDEGRAEELIEWSGDFNHFAGWRSLMCAGPGRAGKVADLAAARAAWSRTDLQSREDPARWTITTELDRVAPEELMTLCPEVVRPTLTRVPTPNPYLLEQTVESFHRPALPRLAPQPPPSITPRAVSAVPQNGAVVKGKAPAPAVRDLAFDLKSPRWRGNLGQFLREEVNAGDRLVRVFVSGGGSFESSPVRLPDGVSLHILPVIGRPANLPAIIWSPTPGEPAEAMIEVHGGDLMISGVRLRRDATDRPRRLVLVEGGHLVLDHCWLTMPPGNASAAGGDLVEFRAARTQPLERRACPYQSSCDRPTCLLTDCILITGGDAVRAEIGRGTVALSNCLVAAGRNAFALQPARVSRARFDATLCLERCTVASEQSFVLLGSWPGSSAGPDRPWLVATKDSAFLGGYDRRTESVLLRVEGDSLSRGTLFWQASNDAFEVSHFTAAAGQTPVTPNWPDVRLFWGKLWGERHMHNVTGRNPKRGTTSVRTFDRLRVADVRPADLELDPTHHPERARLTVGADFERLLIPKRPAPRPR